MKGGQKWVTTEDVVNAIMGNPSESWANDQNMVNCMSLLTILQNIRTKRLYGRFNEIELTPREYEFIVQEGLVDTREISQGSIQQEEQSLRRLHEATKKVSEMHSEKYGLERKLFTLKKGKTLSQLEQDLVLAEEERAKVRMEYDQVKHQEPAYDGEERSISVEENPDRIYVKLNNEGKQTLRDLWCIYGTVNIGSMAYGSPDYQDIIKRFREGEIKDFTGFFVELLDRLNSLSGKAAELISKTTGFDAITYNAHDEKGGGYSVPGSIRYVRNFQECVESWSRECEVEKEYTGFTFDQVDGPRMNECKRGLNFTPRLKTMQVNPSDLGEIIIEHKRRDELSRIYEPSVKEFLRDWTYLHDSGTFWINATEVPEGGERRYIMELRRLDEETVRQIEETFPEAKESFDGLIDRIQEVRHSKDSKMVH